MEHELKKELIILVLLLLFTVTLRLPVNSHAYGSTDSFFIMGLANSIVEFGEAKWIISLYSFAGLYPLSYASMAPFLFAGSSITAGIPIESSVLLSNIVLSILGTFSIYLLTKQITNNNYISFFAAFVFTVSPVFIFYTNWAATARGMFISIFPFFLLLLIRARHQKKYMLMAIITVVLLTTSHRAFFFLAIPLVAFCISLVISRYEGFHKNGIITRLAYLTSMILLFLLQYSSIIDSYSIGFMSASNHSTLENFIYAIANLYISYFGKMGILFVFAIPGFYFLLRKAISFENSFLLLISLFSIPVVTERYYVPLFLAPFLSIIIGYGIYGSYQILVDFLWNEKNYKLANYYYKGNFIVRIYGRIIQLFNSKKNQLLFTYFFILILLISSIPISSEINSRQYKTGTNKPMLEETYQASLFVRSNIDSTLVANNGYIGSQVQAISVKPLLPSNIQLWYSPDQLIFDFEKPENIKATMLPVKQLIPPPDIWFKYSGPSNLKEDYQEIMYFDLTSGSAQKNIKKYNINYLLVDTTMTNYFVSYGVRQSQFVPSVIKTENLIYDSKSISIYRLNK